MDGVFILSDLERNLCLKLDDASMRSRHLISSAKCMTISGC